MEAQEDQLQESGVRYPVNLREMSIAQLEREVRILADRKRKNGENVPEELLTTKYAKAYENLCEQLKFTRGELVGRYVELTRELYEMMADSAYGEFHQLESQDAVAQAFNAAFWSGREYPWELYPDVRSLYEQYNGCLLYTSGERYAFVTQSRDGAVSKSPDDMFQETEIENDLQLVDNTIRESVSYTHLDVYKRQAFMWAVLMYVNVNSLSSNPKPDVSIRTSTTLSLIHI